MSKHKHKKHNKPQQETDREMYQCDVCKKRYPYGGHLLPDSTPFMFIVLGDREHRRFTLAVASVDDIAKLESEQALWFVCSDRQCIYKSFRMWREWDKQDKSTAATHNLIQHFLSLSDEGRKKLARDVSASLGYGHDDEDDFSQEQAATPDNAVVQNPDQGNIFPNQTPE